MHIASTILALAAFAESAWAVGVVGQPAGFASSVTGGGSATPQYPANIAELKSWLADSTPRVIVLNKEFNYVGSEGKVTEAGCRPASNKCPGNGGQDAISLFSWCTNGNAGAGVKSVSVTYDKAALTPLVVGSNKSIIGIGAAGVLKGKGLRITSGAKNVIIQNIHVTQLNPQYIWGGDALTIDGADNVWIDHVKVSLVGRQQLVLGNGASNRVTVSNSEFDGQTSWSATCDGRHYWGIYFTGSNDMVSFLNNYVHHISGRSPKVQSNTLLHAVGNVFFENTGHAFDIGVGGNVLAEANIFNNVGTPLLENLGQLYATTKTNGDFCKASLGRACVTNSYAGNTGSFTGANTAFIKNFQGKTIAGASLRTQASIVASAGVGKI